ncbi:MAG: fumarylacetoacetate hydrolase family protein [Actinomycetota bacterium]
MRLVRCRFEGRPRWAIEDDSYVTPLAGTTVKAVLRRWAARSGDLRLPTALRRPISEVELLAPLPSRDRGIVCTGVNYVEHQVESAEHFAARLPESPIFFMKRARAIADPYGKLELYSSISREFDWEVELAVVLGRRTSHVGADEVGAHIAGYAVLNDVTARDVQREYGQWHLGKNVDRSSPLGPAIVPAAELGYPPSLALRLSVNGREQQCGHTRDMVFSIGTLIERLSRVTPLEPGDVVSTGTPAGVGFTRQPPEYLEEGDVVVAEVEGVGVLRNVISTSVGTR